MLGNYRFICFKITPWKSQRTTADSRFGTPSGLPYDFWGRVSSSLLGTSGESGIAAQELLSKLRVGLRVWLQVKAEPWVEGLRL